MNEELKNQNWGIQLKNCTKDDLKNNLPINNDIRDLVVKQEKLNFNIQSRRDYFNYVKACAAQYKEIETLLSNGKTPKFNNSI